MDPTPWRGNNFTKDPLPSDSAARAGVLSSVAGIDGPIPGGGNVKLQGLSAAVPCLFPGCHEKVRFDLGSANGNGRTPRAHAKCPNGHPHYAEDHVRYGTDRVPDETGQPG